MKKEVFNLEVIAYLKACKEKNKFPNRAGLCVALDLTRSQYFDMRKSGELMPIIERFEQACEDAWVQRLGVNASQGAVFYLKNTFKEDYNDDSTVKLVLPTPILGTLAPTGTAENKKLTTQNV